MDTKKLFEDVCRRDKWLDTHWRQAAKEIPAIYQGDRMNEVPFNILFSNTETIVPALFSQAPQPSVRRRFGETRGDLPALASERMLSYIMDCNMADYPAFVESAECAVMDAALPGLGQLRVRRVNGLPIVDFVPWDKFVWGYARRWEDVPWIAYVHDLTAEEIRDRFELKGDKAAAFPLQDSEKGEEKDADAQGQTTNTHAVYEVYHKRTGKVYFLTAALPEKVLREEDPPFKLMGFYPSPQPLQFVRSTTDTKPRPLYNLYKRQAKELNDLTNRIQRVVSAIRVRGLYNGQIKEIAQLFSGDDMENALVPAENPALLDRSGSLESQIWLIPTEKLVMTLRELMTQREAVKGVIYEILGIGDILRGVSRASETLGAQQLKDKWGSLRITKLRERVARFLRDTLRLALEAAAETVPEPTWAAITGAPILPTVQKMLMQEQGQRVQAPSWKEVLDILRDDMQRSYHIDIETNTTVDAEASDDKAQIAEFMTGLGQVLQSLGPIAQQGPEGFEAVKTIVIEFCKKFRIAGDVLRVLEQLQPPAQGGMPPEVQQQIQQAMEEIQRKQQELAQQEESVKAEKSLAEKQLAAAQKTAAEAKVTLDRNNLALEKLAWVESVLKERVQLAADKADANLTKKAAAVTVSAKTKEAGNAKGTP